MGDSVSLQVLTPAETLLEIERASWVKAQLADGGGIGIYPGHAPLLAETVAAPIRYADAQGEHAFEVEAGILAINADEVTLLTSGESSAATRPTGIPVEGDEKRFDRLAQELLDALAGERDRVLTSDYD
jgi:F-type H+-transporting ATPase subunit epsilon